jgi:altronate dehydratase
VVKICAYPETYRRMADDMDIDGGRILEGKATLDESAAKSAISRSPSAKDPVSRVRAVMVR